MLIFSDVNKKAKTLKGKFSEEDLTQLVNRSSDLAGIRVLDEKSTEYAIRKAIEKTKVPKVLNKVNSALKQPSSRFKDGVDQVFTAKERAAAKKEL